MQEILKRMIGQEQSRYGAHRSFVLRGVHVFAGELSPKALTHHHVLLQMQPPELFIVPGPVQQVPAFTAGVCHVPSPRLRANCDHANGHCMTLCLKTFTSQACFSQTVTLWIPQAVFPDINV